MSEKEGRQDKGMISITREEYDYLVHRATFTSNVIVCAAHRNHNLEFEEGSAREISKLMVEDSIMRGLDVGLFRPDGTMTNLDNLGQFFGLDEEAKMGIKEKWDSAIPWSFVVVFAAEFGVDADVVRQSHKEELVARTAMIGHVGGESGELSEGFKEVFGEFLAGIDGANGGDESEGDGHAFWKSITADKYILVCAHDGHPCEHRFDSVEEAIEAAAVGLMSGELESISHLTMNSETVMGEDELKSNVEVIMNAGSN